MTCKSRVRKESYIRMSSDLFDNLIIEMARVAD